MKQYDCLIIGAGIGGLISALKLSSVGKKVLLLEKQPVAGGFGTSFSRKGFTFESSLHCVDALAEGGEIRQFLQESGIENKVKFIELKDFCRIIYPEHDFVADFNSDNLQNFLKNNFPAEAKNLDKLFSEFSGFYRQFDRFYYSKLPAWLNLMLCPFISPKIIKMSLFATGEVINRYIKDEKLRGMLGDIWRFIGLPPEELSAFYFLIVFRGYFYNPTVYVQGGYNRIFQAIVEKIRENGSEVKLSTTIEKIITCNGAVRGVITEKEEEFTAPVVISNANAISTLTELLDNQSVREIYKKKLSCLKKSISAFQVYLGLRFPAKQLGMSNFMYSLNSTYNHNDNFKYSLEGNYQFCPLSLVDHAQVDSSLVPEGKGSLLIMALDSYFNWNSLTDEEYRQKKIEAAQQLINRAEKYLPGLSSNIEVMEIASPRTMAHYGVSPEGAIYGFSQTVKQASINRLPQKTVIKGLILAGAWTQPGAGVHGCFVSGIDAANLALSQLR
ncbi:MAG: NAD(P)/FAD-dependent oxidoreductase [Candidatus Omnitrophica bacterium]|jgi:prolycopene isomerase|nr:NAD(P)/FAD-dependent oxidoreductase [Candidatus Omnitrophota bacterium]